MGKGSVNRGKGYGEEKYNLQNLMDRSKPIRLFIILF